MDMFMLDPQKYKRNNFFKKSVDKPKRLCYNDHTMKGEVNESVCWNIYEEKR